jgi:predicted MFS family arabinose efflux permease
MLAWASSFYLPAILAAPIARDLELPVPWIYAMLSLGLGVSAVLGPMLGRSIDRHGGRPVLCASSLAFAAGLLLLAAARGRFSLLAAWLVLGAAMAAGLYESAFAALTRRYGHDSHGAITGITLIAGFASTVGWPLSALLEHALGWRGTCITWAALHLCIGLPLNAWALRSENEARPESPVVAPARPLPSQRQGMLILAFIFTVSGTVGLGIVANLPPLLEAMGATAGAALAAASLFGPAQVIARILEYSARRRINPLISGKIACALHPVGALMIAAAGAPAVAMFSVCHGAGNGMLTIVRGTLPLALYGPVGYGARIARIAIPARIGQALAPFLFGVAITKLGAWTLGISSVLYLAALLALGALSLPPRPAVDAVNN